MTTFRKQFARNLKSLRTCAGLSQEELAERLGLAPKTVSYWENGHNAVTFDKLPQLAAALDVPVYKLFVFGAELSAGNPQDIADVFASMTEREHRAISQIIALILGLR